MSAGFVRFEHVGKRFGAVEVLRDVDLAIDEGELVTLVGPSGCGKSTLLNLLAGFERPSAGHVWIDGRVVDDASPSDRGLAMVFQSYALYPHLDVRGNIGFPLSIAKVAAREITTRVEEMAARLGLGELLERRPAELSGGQRQRVALARALVRRPRLCLFDEPLSNLDAALRGKMRVELKKLHEELGATFVYVTHDQSEAMTLSDRVVVLERGRIAQVGAPREVYEQPASVFVAGFVGSPAMSLVSAATLGLEADDGVVFGLRPEAVAVELDARPGAREATIWAVEPTGPETWVTLRVGAGLEAEELLGRAPAAFAGRPGDRAFSSFARGDVHRFDRASGLRLCAPREP
jgi:multiple sugar transport system ATP-binding protein